MMACRIARTMTALKMTPRQLRQKISRLNNKRPAAIRRHFINILVQRQANQAQAKAVRSLSGNKDLIDSCHHGDYRDVVPKLPLRSVKLFIADPPYGVYRRPEATGGYVSVRSDTNGLRTDCDANTSEEAAAVTMPLFEVCLPHLAPGGCMLLFQAGGRADRSDLLAEAERQGWDCLYAVNWDKGATRAPIDTA